MFCVFICSGFYRVSLLIQQCGLSRYLQLFISININMNGREISERITLICTYVWLKTEQDVSTGGCLSAAECKTCCILVEVFTDYST